MNDSAPVTSPAWSRDLRPLQSASKRALTAAGSLATRTVEAV